MRALVDVDTSIIWIAFEALSAEARVVAGLIEAVGVDAARTRTSALIDVRAQLFTVAFEARFTFASEVRW